MPDGGFATQVLMCWPTDKETIKTLNNKLRPEQQFTPSIEHSLSTCDGCTRDVWIGPQQLQLAVSVFVQARKLCIMCAEAVQRTLRLTPREVDLNPALRFAPRRT